MLVVLIGDLEVARLACATMLGEGHQVVHLLSPTEAQLKEALQASIDGVAVVVRNDVTALRYALLVEHIRPGIRLVATIFDRTLAHQLTRVVSNCTITSPADVAVPSLVGACLGNDVLAVVDIDGRPSKIVASDAGASVVLHRRQLSRWRSTGDTVLGQLRPSDDTTRILFVGGVGLLANVAIDWFVSATALHESATAAFYRAARIAATVGPASATGPTWYLIFSAVSMLLSIGLLALFTAGIVNRVLSQRSIGVVGRRTKPRRHHVVVVGLGQVGFRLAIRLRELGIPVIAVERNAEAANIHLAKSLSIPVLVGHGAERAALVAARARFASAVACVGSDDLGNVEIAISALAVDPSARVVIRAGEGDIVAETKSLFKIGAVCDVSRLTAAAVFAAITESSLVVYSRNEDVFAVEDGRHVRVDVAERCSCAADTASELGATPSHPGTHPIR